MPDDDLRQFEAQGAAPLPVPTEPGDGRGFEADYREGYVEHEGARIWYACYGHDGSAGPPVVLLHGGLGHSGNWDYQVPALLGSGYRVVLLDSRGHGRSTQDSRPFSYELMASDTLAVMDGLGLERAAVVGWSDGACTALVLGSQAPARVAGVFFFACNMDPSGTKEMTELPPIVARCFQRHTKDYARLSATPDQWEAFVAAVSLMQQTQPKYTPDDLARIRVPVAIVQSEHDEFIRDEHAAYLARTIPGATLTILPGVSHFAPLQRPEPFNAALLAFLGKVLPQSGSGPA